MVLAAWHGYWWWALFFFLVVMSIKINHVLLDYCILTRASVNLLILARKNEKGLEEPFITSRIRQWFNLSIQELWVIGSIEVSYYLSLFVGILVIASYLVSGELPNLSDILSIKITYVR
jgi:hypothetical protein